MTLTRIKILLLAPRDEWSQVAFKGSGETGVLNLTTALTSPSGKQYYVSAPSNAQAALDNQKLYDACRILLRSRQDPPD